MANYIKRELDTFEYDKRYYLPNEHRWCFMADDEEHKKYWEKKEESLKPIRSRVQSNPEKTGQIGSMITE